MSLRNPALCAFALSAALASALAPSLAHACWDGVAVSTDKVVVAIESSETWSPEQARHWAKWIARIDALVPEGKTLNVTHGYAEVCDVEGECEAIGDGWDRAGGFTIFERTADLFDASRRSIADARRMNVVPLTVQVAASHDLLAAEKLAARINAAELELAGFYDVGGFPAANPYTHVVESFDADGATYHVVVGAFLERHEAEHALHSLEGELGVHGFVRALEQSSITEEGC